MPEPARRATILIADDDVGHRRVLELVLSAHNYDTMCVQDGHEALTYLQGNRPDAMILDVRMPFSSGLEVCQRARRVARLRNVPVIIMTSLADDRAVQAAEAAGASLLVPKPISGKSLAQLLGELLAVAPD